MRFKKNTSKNRVFVDIFHSILDRFQNVAYNHVSGFIPRITEQRYFDFNPQMFEYFYFYIIGVL